MLKIIAGSAVAALIMLAAPGAASAASADKSPAVKQGNEMATDMSSRHRRWHRPRYRYVRPYYSPYAYYPRSYYGPSYGYAPSYGYGYPYRRPGISFGFGF